LARAGPHYVNPAKGFESCFLSFSDGAPILDGPRRTGDGSYEVVALDPDGNRVEICAAPHAT